MRNATTLFTANAMKNGMYEAQVPAHITRNAGTSSAAKVRGRSGGDSCGTRSCMGSPSLAQWGAGPAAHGDVRHSGVPEIAASRPHPLASLAQKLANFRSVGRRECPSIAIDLESDGAYPCDALGEGYRWSAASPACASRWQPRCYSRRWLGPRTTTRPWMAT